MDRREKDARSGLSLTVGCRFLVARRWNRCHFVLNTKNLSDAVENAVEGPPLK